MPRATRPAPTGCASATGPRWWDDSLAEAGLPTSVIVTTIQRQRDLMVPRGATVLEAGDELVLIGRSGDIDAVRTIASPAGRCAAGAVIPDRDLAVTRSTTEERRP